MQYFIEQYNWRSLVYANYAIARLLLFIWKQMGVKGNFSKQKSQIAGTPKFFLIGWAIYACQLFPKLKSVFRKFIYTKLEIFKKYIVCTERESIIRFYSNFENSNICSVLRQLQKLIKSVHFIPISGIWMISVILFNWIVSNLKFLMGTTFSNRKFPSQVHNFGIVPSFVLEYLNDLWQKLQNSF